MKTGKSSGTDPVRTGYFFLRKKRSVKNRRTGSSYSFRQR